MPRKKRFASDEGTPPNKFRKTEENGKGRPLFFNHLYAIKDENGVDMGFFSEFNIDVSRSSEESLEEPVNIESDILPFSHIHVITDEKGNEKGFFTEFNTVVTPRYTDHLPDGHVVESLEVPEKPLEGLDSIENNLTS